jgi:hypothetical protein
VEREGWVVAKLAGLKIGVSEETLRRVRDYAVNEPSFTAAFAAWDLSRTGEPISAEAVRLCIPALCRQGVIALVEDNGTGGRVYKYRPPEWQPKANRRRLFSELDDARVGELRPAQTGPVPHTRTEGSSGKPNRDRKRQAKGVRVKRGRSKGYGGR